jgi:hypothetical protein
MSETPVVLAPENHTHFAIVVDGELAWLHSIDNILGGAVASFQSSPTIVEVSAEQFQSFVNGTVPPYGNYLWDGTNWSLSPEAGA